MNKIDWKKVFWIALSAALASGAHEVMREVMSQKRIQ